MALSAQVSIRFHRKKDFIGLQRVEGLIMVSASIASMVSFLFFFFSLFFLSFFSSSSSLFFLSLFLKREQYQIDHACIWKSWLDFPFSLSFTRWKLDEK